MECYLEMYSSNFTLIFDRFSKLLFEQLAELGFSSEETPLSISRSVSVRHFLPREACSFASCFIALFYGNIDLVSVWSFSMYF